MSLVNVCYIFNEFWGCYLEMFSNCFFIFENRVIEGY